MSEIEILSSESFLSGIRFDSNGLVPAIIQDWNDGTVLMLGYMNQESLRLTLEKRKVVFWSRSRQKLWMKGETSNNFLNVRQVSTDCDMDAILIKAEADGPTCHTGKRTCFSWWLEEEKAGQELA
jgi:phosphoribosyl-ATP pyrophosphohydrolase/phosphoribosyl-AMP cyclohydrolase